MGKETADPCRVLRDEREKARQIRMGWEGHSANTEKQVKRLRKCQGAHPCPGNWVKLSVAGLQLK